MDVVVLSTRVVRSRQVFRLRLGTTACRVSSFTVRFTATTVSFLVCVLVLGMFRLVS